MLFAQCPPPQKFFLSRFGVCDTLSLDQTTSRFLMFAVSTFMRQSKSITRTHISFPSYCNQNALLSHFPIAAVLSCSALLLTHHIWLSFSDVFSFSRMRRRAQRMRMMAQRFLRRLPHLPPHLLTPPPLCFLFFNYKGTRMLG